MLEFIKIRDMTLYVKKSSKKSSLIPAWVGGQMAISDLLSDNLRSEIDICNNLENNDQYINKELNALLPILKKQKDLSDIPKRNQLLIEIYNTKELTSLFVFTLDGKFVNEGIAFLWALRFANKKQSTFSISANDFGFSLTTSENEVAAMGGDAAAGHLTSAPYFMVHESAENEKFVSAYKKRWGSDKVTHFVSEPAYFGVGIFKQALEKIGKAGDINPTAIMEACKGQEIMTPQGKIKIDPDNLHCYLWPKIGICKSNGQYDIIRKTDNWLKPLPYAAYPDQTCKEGGLV